MLAVYEVTKILLGHGADGSVRRAYHRDTGTHRSRPRRTGQPLAPAMSVALSLEGKAAFPLPGVDASDGSGDRHALKYLSRTAYHGHVDDKSPDREVNVLKIFQAHPHPNVLRLLEVFAPSLPSRPHWVFATVEAETTLRAIIYKHNALLRQGDGAAAHDFGRQILEGIRHMHRHRVIHRDLKPDNILVSFDLAVRSPAPSLENLTDVVGAHTWQARVQIADFSRARGMPEMVNAINTRIIGKTQNRSNIAAMSVMICTRPYAAPEIMAQDHDAKHAYGTSVDIWSFGCVFFELLFGDTFAPGKNCLELVAWWQVRLERPLPDHLCVELSVDLKRVDKAAHEICEKNPHEKLGHASALAVEHWLGRTLVYEAAERSSATTLLSEHWLPKKVEALRGTSKDLGLHGLASDPAAPRGCRADQTSSASSAASSAAAASIASDSTTATPWSATAARALGSTAAGAAAMTSGTCKCKGNCVRRNEHRTDSNSRRCGCPNRELHQACSLCDVCKCKVPSCHGPGHRSVYCSMHSRIFEAAKWPLKAAIAMGPLAELMLPADVTDLREQVSQPLIRADLASIIAIALIKEPSVTAALVRSGCLAAMADPTCAAEDVAARLTDLLSREEVQKASECSELGAQGVSRVMGFASTLRRLGVITPAESEPKPQRKKPRTASSSRGSRRPEIFHLGALRRQYTKTGDASTLGRFLNACRANQAAWSLVLTDGSIQSVVEQIDQIMTSVATESQVLQAEGGGYVRKFIARKLLLVCVWEGALDTTRVWSDTSVEQLEGFMPDQTGYLETIPKHWSCEELSQFVFGRGDMVLYVSMYACLWKSVEASTKPKTRSAIIDSAMIGGRESEVGKQARALFDETGHQCTPKTIIARMVQNGKL